MLREKDLKYSLFLYGSNFVNDTPPDFTNNAHKLGKRYVNQLYDIKIDKIKSKHPTNAIYK